MKPSPELIQARHKFHNRYVRWLYMTPAIAFTFALLARYMNMDTEIGYYIMNLYRLFNGTR